MLGLVCVLHSVVLPPELMVGWVGPSSRVFLALAICYRMMLLFCPVVIQSIPFCPFYRLQFFFLISTFPILVFILQFCIILCYAPSLFCSNAVTLGDISTCLFQIWITNAEKPWWYCSYIYHNMEMFAPFIFLAQCSFSIHQNFSNFIPIT